MASKSATEQLMQESLSRENARRIDELEKTVEELVKLLTYNSLANDVQSEEILALKKEKQ